MERWLPFVDAKDPVVYAASSSNPVGYRYHNNKCTVIVLTGIARPAFAFYKLRQKSEKWIKKDSSIIDPYCSDPHERAHLLRFTNGIWFKDKFYALSLHGTLAVIEDIGSDLRITALGKKRAVPSVSSKRFGELAKGDSSAYELYDPIAESWWCIPLWDAKVPLCAALSSSANDMRRSLIQFLPLHMGRRRLDKKDSTIDPPLFEPATITNGVWCKEKFFVLILQGTLAVIEDIDSDIRITAL
ncbi:hypothetical protein GH714_028726 [Hevea brasiliensis]|uniref:Uncharacterized protein n=1 Tax=Hevea brasiliensis TaxID=3981 RepID=A0A6A6N8R8_HEVBR|nr:hypothetical protein GH714_028726 [Hevea brasiliensis]